MTIRCICIDDEPNARQGLAYALKQYDDFELVAQYGAADTFLAALEENKVTNIDVLFVDIEMPRMNGFEMLSQFKGVLPIVVFVTAYDKYAVQAFEQQALDYILKPINDERFAQVITRIRHSLRQPKSVENVTELRKKINLLREKVRANEAKISVKTEEGYFRVKLSEVLFIEAVGDHVCIHLTNQQLITRNTLKHYKLELAEFNFEQIHKSTLVNIKHIVKYEKLRFSDYQIELSNHHHLRLSRRYKHILDLL